MERDVFDYIDDEETPRKRNPTAIVWNILTVLVLLSAVAIGILFSWSKKQWFINK